MIFPKWLLFILVFIQCYLIYLRPETFALSLATFHFQRFRIEASRKMKYKVSSIISWSKYRLKVNDHWISNTNIGKRNRSDIVIIIWKEVETSFYNRHKGVTIKLHFSMLPTTCSLLEVYLIFFILLWGFFSPMSFFPPLINCPSFSSNGFHSPAASPFLPGVLLYPRVMNLDNV